MRHCVHCDAPLRYRGVGRPPKYCRDCAEKQRAYRERNKDEIAEKQRAYRERNKDEIAEKQRAYRERNKDEIAEKQRARTEASLTCSGCGERLRQATDSGLCGFCLEEAAA